MQSGINIFSIYMLCSTFNQNLATQNALPQSRDLPLHLLTYNHCYSRSVNIPEKPLTFKNYHIPNKKKKGLYITKNNKMNSFNDLIHDWYNGIYHGNDLYILGILLEETKSTLAKAISEC